jgi:hypothetical protein
MIIGLGLTGILIIGLATLFYYVGETDYSRKGWLFAPASVLCSFAGIAIGLGLVGIFAANLLLYLICFMYNLCVKRLPGSQRPLGEANSASLPPTAVARLRLVRPRRNGMWFFFPSKKPTPSEYAVLVVSSSVLFVVVGAIELGVASRAPEREHELAVALTHRGFWCLGIGVTIAVAYWLYRRLKN